MPLEFQLPKYYKVTIGDNGLVNIISNSKHKKGRPLSIHLDKDGYPKVKVNNVSQHVHSVVAAHYFGKLPKGYSVNHKDCIKTNNHPDNLEYITIAENIKHAIANGLHVCTRPEMIGTYKDGRTRNLAAYKSSHYLKNKEKYRERAKAHYLQNRDKFLEKARSYYQASKYAKITKTETIL